MLRPVPVHILLNTGNSLILNLVDPYGVNVILVCAPVHEMFVGGLVTNVVPANAQLIGHATTLIDTGGLPESKMGEGMVVVVLGAGVNTAVEGSMAYAQGPVASNS
jgi:hypothetical protein